MRKFLIFTIVICILLACGRNEEKRIVVWHSMRPDATEILKEQLRIFGGRHPGWKFRELFYAPETARTNFIISAIGGSGPALFWGASDNIGPFVELEVIKPIEPYLTEAFLDSFITDPIPANTWYKNHLYQIADRVGNHLCLVYNKKYIQNPPKTMSKLIEMGKDLLENPDFEKLEYALAWNYTEPFFAIPFIGGFGGWIMDENYQPTLNTPATVKAAKFIYDLANVEKIIPVESDYETANALFKDGLTAMIINGPWSWNTYLENGIDIGIARIPKIDETGLWPTPIISPLGYSLNTNLTGEKLEIAVELLKFLTSTEVELVFTKAMATVPSRKEALEDPIVKNNDLLRNSITQIEVGRPMPVVTELRWIWDAMRPAYQGIFTGKYTPEQAANMMQELAVKLIKENRQ
ncbi:extracellular solute-binding protein [candidate division KSB1 bacterium]|nr:extracellular solute-binding protein [candidate division KSB1 bacterium]